MKKMMMFKGCQDTGALLLRLGVGITFFAHGWSKVVDMEGTLSFFNSLGLAPFWAYLVTWVELLGGAAVVLGALTTIAGVLLAINMVVAIIMVKFQRGFLGGYELDFVLLLSSLAVAMLTGGKYSVDRMFCKKDTSPQV